MNADEQIPPASLTKLMTLHLALQAIEEGKLSLSQVVVPSPNAWAENMPPHSSLMFLGPNQTLTVDKLLKGLVVDSGNDAAVEVADLIGGSVPGFVDLMNQEAARLGYRVMHFVDPAGISASNVITAREYADFARWFVLAHAESLGDFFTVRQLTYPLPANLTGSQSRETGHPAQPKCASGQVRWSRWAKDGLYRRIWVQHGGHGGAGRHAADCRDPRGFGGQAP